MPASRVDFRVNVVSGVPAATVLDGKLIHLGSQSLCIAQAALSRRSLWNSAVCQCDTRCAFFGWHTGGQSGHTGGGAKRRLRVWTIIVRDSSFRFSYTSSFVLTVGSGFEFDSRLRVLDEGLGHYSWLDLVRRRVGLSIGTPLHYGAGRGGDG